MTPQQASYKPHQSTSKHPAAHGTLVQPAPTGESTECARSWTEASQEAPVSDLAFGMPAERHARQAAGRAFVALKLSFQYVVDRLTDKPELQERVRLAEEPHELWALRASVFAALTGEDPHHRSHRQLLNRSLETMFPMDSHRLN